ncbi:hypothetical protein MVEN_00899800 [Mycena venus]|uniref:Peptidase C14 caspase domain-containing protein n=1 Tax=Mycena venus TaxID=2733690 RepID=A0A8H6YEZ6_9AGAR|nr:hypothetical protein MVEN_00899800 [Mycena venus]
MASPTSIAGVTTSGIQDVSGFLPLLGTEQCEEHVNNALERGFFYAAGSPMSIFGSLGIIKAGLMTLWVSIDEPWFHGPRQMRNAGFFPKGIMSKLSYALDSDDSIYIAEKDIRSILYRCRSVDVTINLRCWPWICWHLWMLLFSIGFGSLGLLPYIYIIRVDLRDRPFSQSWLFPVLRISGSVLAAIMIQLVIQLRILFVVNSRLRFHAINTWFQTEGKMPPFAWNPDTRSEMCLLTLANDITHFNAQQCKQLHGDLEYLRGLDRNTGAMRPLQSFKADGLGQSKTSSRYLPEVPFLLLVFCRLLLLVGIAASGIGYIGCFGLVQASNSSSINGPGTWLGVEVFLCLIRLVIWASNPGFDDPPAPIAITHGQEGKKMTYEVGWNLADVTVDDLHALVIGVDELIHPSPEVPRLTGAVHDANSVITYLENDLAVPKSQIKRFFDAKATSSAIKKSLDDLAMDRAIQPGAPIIIYIACHTMAEGSSTGTAERPSPVPTEGTTGTTGRMAMLLPKELYDYPRPQRPPTFVTADYQMDNPGTGLKYTEFLDLVQAIYSTKGNNITVILDTCMAGQLGKNTQFDKNAATSDFLIGYPSHVLLAACTENQQSYEDTQGRGGFFTRALLTRLIGKPSQGETISKEAPPNEYSSPTKTSKNESGSSQLTYRGLIEGIREDMKIQHKPQTPVCSGNFQNRLLFNGLLARKHPARDMSVNNSLISIRSNNNTMPETNETFWP